MPRGQSGPNRGEKWPNRGEKWAAKGYARVAVLSTKGVSGLICGARQPSEHLRQHEDAKHATQRVEAELESSLRVLLRSQPIVHQRHLLSIRAHPFGTQLAKLTDQLYTPFATQDNISPCAFKLTLLYTPFANHADISLCAFKLTDPFA